MNSPSELVEIRVRAATWNVAGLAPAASTRDDILHLLPPEELGAFSIVAVGLQEVSASAGSLWTRATAECPWPAALRRHLSPHGFVHLSCLYLESGRSRLAGAVLCVFVKRELLPRIQRIITRNLATGLSGYSPHKGTVAMHIRFKDETNLTFLNSHFAPHNEQLAARIKEYRLVLSSLSFCGGSQAVISDDYVIWVGDLNFRVDFYSIEEAAKIAKSSDRSSLLSNDQLSRVRRAGEAFQDFEEGALAFPPTYRFPLASNDYDLKRLPSWCDRILWRAAEVVGVPKRRPARTLSLRLDEGSYSSVPRAAGSDHKPVRADFRLQVSVQPGDSNWAVEFDDPLWLSSQENLCSYSFCDPTYTPSSFDWIGIYKAAFWSDVDDSVTWSYALTAWDDGGTMRLIFKKQYMPIAGEYCLAYYSRERQCLIGLSNPFTITSSLVERGDEA